MATATKTRKAATPASEQEPVTAVRPTKDQKFYVTIDMAYDAFHLEPGEIFQPLGRENDRALVNVDYFKEIAKDYPNGYEAAQCTRCGKIFVDSTYKVIHDSKCPPAEINLSEEIMSNGGRVVDLNELPDWTPANTP